MSLINLNNKRHPDEYIRLKLGELSDSIENGTLITQTEYQRDYIWKDKYKQEFIISLINGLHIPCPIINKRGDGKIYCIDGNQRLTTIHHFIKNKFSVKLGIRTEFNQMTQEQQKNFRDITLDFSLFFGLTTEEESLMFDKYQNTMILKPGEKLGKNVIGQNFKSILIGKKSLTDEFNNKRHESSRTLLRVYVGLIRNLDDCVDVDDILNEINWDYHIFNRITNSATFLSTILNMYNQNKNDPRFEFLNRYISKGKTESGRTLNHLFIYIYILCRYSPVFKDDGNLACDIMRESLELFKGSERGGKMDHQFIRKVREIIDYMDRKYNRIWDPRAYDKLRII